MVKVADCTENPLVLIDLHHALTIELHYPDFVSLSSAPYVRSLFNKGDYIAIIWSFMDPYAAILL